MHYRNFDCIYTIYLTRRFLISVNWDITVTPQLQDIDESPRITDNDANPSNRFEYAERNKARTVLIGIVELLYIIDCVFLHPRSLRSVSSDCVRRSATAF